MTLSLTPSFSPPWLTQAEPLNIALQSQGFAVLQATTLSALSGCPIGELMALRPFWEQLPADEYLKDGGRYRRRRHASYVVEGEQCRLQPHRAHWQPLAYNALHGGMQRWFEPLSPAWQTRAVWPRLLIWLGQVCSALKGRQPWFVEAHTFRIDTTDGIGRPTPEGAHRDGVDLVAVFLVARQGIKGGETRVFEATGPQGQRFTLTEPWSVLLLDDARMIHESTPIQPLDAAAPPSSAHRDTLVVTLRARGFQEAPGV